MYPYAHRAPSPRIPTRVAKGLPQNKTRQHASCVLHGISSNFMTSTHFPASPDTSLPQKMNVVIADKPQSTSAVTLEALVLVDGLLLFAHRFRGHAFLASWEILLLGGGARIDVGLGFLTQWCSVTRVVVVVDRGSGSGSLGHGRACDAFSASWQIFWFRGCRCGRWLRA
jgi:hypothetical protein